MHTDERNLPNIYVATYIQCPRASAHILGKSHFTVLWLIYVSFLLQPVLVELYFTKALDGKHAAKTRVIYVL